MTARKELLDEIREAIEAREAAHLPVQKSWLVHQIVSAHDAAISGDTAWHRNCAFDAVSAGCRAVLREEVADEDLRAAGEEQLVLPGYTYVRHRYSNKCVNGTTEQGIVQLVDMTYKQVRAKIAELRHMAQGNTAHANELEHYCDARWPEGDPEDEVAKSGT